MPAMPRTFHRSTAPTLLQAFRRRASGRICAVVLSMFALGIASQSLLGTLVSLHELTSPAHVVHGTDGHMLDHDHDHDHQAAVHDGSDADEGEPLHVLMHHTHCCSHSVWMSSGVAIVALVEPVRSDLSADKIRPLLAFERTAPFRPPIAV
jgi:hypothetical protein